MEIDEIDGKDGHVYRLKKNWWNTGNINRGEINETHLVQVITKELMLLVWLIIVLVLLR